MLRVLSISCKAAKAIKLVCKLMNEMSDEEFLKLATLPVVFRDPGGNPERSQSRTDFCSRNLSHTIGTLSLP